MSFPGRSSCSWRARTTSRAEVVALASTRRATSRRRRSARGSTSFLREPWGGPTRLPSQIMPPAGTADALVTGAGGFIGGHLVARLLNEGRSVRAVDVKPDDEWYQRFDDADNRVLDLSLRDACEEAVVGTREVFSLAADMGGMGFIEGNRALCMLSVLVNTHMLLAARGAGVERFFYSSSACVYAAGKQDSA